MPPAGPFFCFFTLAVDFGKLRRTCQVIPNSKFFQVIFKQARTEENVNKEPSINRSTSSRTDTDVMVVGGETSKSKPIPKLLDKVSQHFFLCIFS